MCAAEAGVPLLTLNAFERRLADGSRVGLALLVVRLPELERVAWRRGLRAARALERRAVVGFSRAVSRVLRSGDLVAHEPGSDVFVAALVSPTRDGAEPAPIDARSALARIATALESATRQSVVTGWTTYDPLGDRDAIDAALERALVRGAQERERYAFFSALGHELRTPLSSIRGYLETLLDEDVDRRTQQHFVRIAYNESLRLTRLVEGMFEISLLDLHAALPVGATCSVAAALDAAREACLADAEARGVTFVLDCAHQLNVAIDGDRLTLALINVIGNAVKHGRRGGTIRVATNVGHGRLVRIVVEDDGPGISAEDRERIFALGVRGVTEADGTGIGLAVVRLVIERAGGRVDLDESPLGGARFALSIPRSA